MSYNDIADFFSQYPPGKSKNCKHLKELFFQSIAQLEEEEEIPIVIRPSKDRYVNFKNKKRG